MRARNPGTPAPRRQHPAGRPLRESRPVDHPVRSRGLPPHHLLRRPPRRDGHLAHHAARGCRTLPGAAGQRNRVEAGRLEDGRHFATWHNPHPTPAYLFALVAGQLQAVTRQITTADGREVELAVWAAPADVPRCGFALEAVERALRWDEERFGRCYDLDVFNIVAAQDFNMGAMENKGLNIFNARFILADPDTATDLDYLAIEAVIGHEYFHNWSGNRVTLRDWFQLSLKEGLTVFRDQEFTADLHSRAVKRIEDVRLLRARQFAEDAGSLAHPVRTAQYSEINNFYTLTVYEKGAEIVRMLHTLLGEEDFRAGLDRYFSDNDGRAATVEDFLAALSSASGRDLDAYLQWYAQSGTPRLEVAGTQVDGRFQLDIRQHTPPTDAQPEPAALPLPLRIALFDADGKSLPLDDAQVEGGRLHGDLLEIDGEHTRLRITAGPLLPSLNRGFSAPVKVSFDYSAAELGRLARIESDPFSRWEAVQRLAAQAMLGGDRSLADALSDALGDLLEDDAADPAFVTECLALPDFDTLAEQVESIDVDTLVAAREDLLERLAEDHADRCEARYHALAESARGGIEGPAMAARGLRNACLGWLTRLDPLAVAAQAQFNGAGGMTERLGALRALVHFDAPAAQAALESFRSRHGDDPLVTDKWLTLVGTRPATETLDDVTALVASPYWTPSNPNRVRAIIGSFSRMNPVAFHRADGRGYELLAEHLPALDDTNPQLAARLLGAFESWKRLTGPRRALARARLQALQPRLRSRDCQDLLSRLLS
ncbi:aminopeptidase N [Alkalisalibacterium limincola]|uniref:aminopeptidase N n=1 Tax=Alkalisalibacterium limincola TaxID=2699169 RepID=UPI002106360D|nr:aminopeptidase N [Alkalisalibacterium limincola]